METGERDQIAEERGDGEEKPSLFKRKDFLGLEEAAKRHPNRTYYFRNQDLEAIIEQCTAKLKVGRVRVVGFI